MMGLCCSFWGDMEKRRCWYSLWTGRGEKELRFSQCRQSWKDSQVTTKGLLSRRDKLSMGPCSLHLYQGKRMHTDLQQNMLPWWIWGNLAPSEAWPFWIIKVLYWLDRWPETSSLIQWSVWERKIWGDFGPCLREKSEVLSVKDCFPPVLRAEGLPPCMRIARLCESYQHSGAAGLLCPECLQCFD